MWHLDLRERGKCIGAKQVYKNFEERSFWFSNSVQGKSPTMINEEKRAAKVQRVQQQQRQQQQQRDDREWFGDHESAGDSMVWYY
jgi:hypothetical protein